MRKRGTDSPSWKQGYSINEKGYQKVRTRHANYNKYVHRVVIEKLLENPLCADYVFPIKGQIPPGMVVHHTDHCRTHNCHGNLQLLAVRIHNILSSGHRKYLLDHYEEYLDWIHEQDVPDWVTEVGEDDGQYSEMVE